MKIIMNLEVSKGYSIWKEVFLNNEDNRQRHNVKVLAYGHEEGNENKVLQFYKFLQWKLCKKC